MALIAYLDASVIVPCFVLDVFSKRAIAFLQIHKPIVVLSDFAAAEFASVIARRVRTGEMTLPEARDCLATFDTWRAGGIRRERTLSGDIAAAEDALRRLDLTLRTPDAINIAIARRIGASLVTFDARMADSARLLGVEVAAA